MCNFASVSNISCIVTLSPVKKLITSNELLMQLVAESKKNMIK